MSVDAKTEMWLALEELVLLIEDQWLPERQEAMEQKRKECEKLVELSACSPNPWCFTTETMKRAESELITPLRAALKRANKVLDAEGLK